MPTSDHRRCQLVAIPTTVIWEERSVLARMATSYLSSRDLAHVGYPRVVQHQPSIRHNRRVKITGDPTGAHKRWLSRVALTALWWTLALLFVLPLLWMISTSVKNDAQVYHVPPVWLPWPVRPQNYLEALRVQPFGLFFLNSLQYSGAAVLGELVSCSLAAYGFSRLRWRGRDVLFALCLATMMLPDQVTMIPLFLIFRALGWINTYRPLIIPTFFGSGYFIFLLRQFFLTIPTEFSEAAHIDGATELRIFLDIVLPLAKPALAVLALFEFFFTWDNYLGPLIYLDSTHLYPVALGLQLMQSSFVEKLIWPYLMSATMVSIVPLIVLFLLTQRVFVQGIAISGLRG
ncbi:MAG: carbohydrate ABC transporter permease [Chloroflexi bacterium]|nr:carbohydrate ABC transporter permease [Chloroflexota bacterium]